MSIFNKEIKTRNEYKKEYNEKTKSNEAVKKAVRRRKKREFREYAKTGEVKPTRPTTIIKLKEYTPPMTYSHIKTNASGDY